MKKEKTKFRYHKITPLLKQLVADIKPAPERLNIKTDIEKVRKKDIEV